MHLSMLEEAISLLIEVRSQQGNTGDSVVEKLDQVIENLFSLRGSGLSEPEVMVSVLEEFGALFSEFPEIQQKIEYLASLES